MFRVHQGKISTLRKMVDAIAAIFPVSYLEMSSDGFSLETFNHETSHYARLHVDPRWFSNSLASMALGKTITLTDNEFSRLLSTASPNDDFLDIYLSFGNDITSLILQFVKPNRQGERTETLIVTQAQNPNTQLANNPAYTFQVDMKADLFLPFLQQAVEDGESPVRLQMRNSGLTISTGNNPPIQLLKDLGCRSNGISDDICCNLEVPVSSLRADYLNSLSEYLHFITIKVVNPRVNLKRIWGVELPPLLESEIKFDELAKIRFHYPLQVVTAPSVMENL